MVALARCSSGADLFEPYMLGFDPPPPPRQDEHGEPGGTRAGGKGNTRGGNRARQTARKWRRAQKEDKRERVIVVVRSPYQENNPAGAHTGAHKSLLESANPAWTRSVHLDARHSPSLGWPTPE